MQKIEAYSSSTSDLKVGECSAEIANIKSFCQAIKVLAPLGGKLSMMLVIKRFQILTRPFRDIYGVTKKIEGKRFDKIIIVRLCFIFSSKYIFLMLRASLGNSLTNFESFAVGKWGLCGRRLKFLLISFTVRFKVKVF